MKSASEQSTSVWMATAAVPAQEGLTADACIQSLTKRVPVPR